MFKRFFERLRGPSGQATINILSSALVSGIGFITLPLIMRMLSVGNYGILSIYTAWMSIFSLFIGLQTGGTLGTARVHFGEENYTAYRTSALLIAFASFAGIAIITILFLGPISAALEMERPIVLLLLAHSFGLFGVSFVTVHNIYTKQAIRNLVLSLLVALLNLALSVILINLIVNSDRKYIGRILGSSLPNILIGIPLVVFFAFHRTGRIKKEYFRYCLAMCLPLVLSALSQAVLAQSDRVMMQKLHFGEEVIGIYSLMYTFCGVMPIISAALNNAFVPFYYDDLHSGDTAAIRRKGKNYVRLYTGITAGFLLLAPDVIRWYAGEAYASGIPLIPVLTAANYMIFLYHFPVNFEFYNRKTRLIAIGTALAALLNIGLNGLFIPRYGALGAAVATALAYMALFVFHEINARRMKAETAYHYQFSMYLPGIACLLLACVAFYLLERQWYIRWPAAVAIGAYLLIRIKRQRGIF